MNQLNFPILSLITLLPLAGALLLRPRANERLIKGWALGVSLATFAASLLLYAYFQGGTAAMK
jgi:NADH:ubiquinone oxidoreductase subunit 4 (subunit M)